MIIYWFPLTFLMKNSTNPGDKNYDTGWNNSFISALPRGLQQFQSWGGVAAEERCEWGFRWMIGVWLNLLFPEWYMEQVEMRGQAVNIEVSGLLGWDRDAVRKDIASCEKWYNYGHRLDVDGWEARLKEFEPYAKRWVRWHPFFVAWAMRTHKRVMAGEL